MNFGLRGGGGRLVASRAAAVQRHRGDLPDSDQGAVRTRQVEVEGVEPVADLTAAPTRRDVRVHRRVLSVGRERSSAREASEGLHAALDGESTAREVTHLLRKTLGIWSVMQRPEQERAGYSPTHPWNVTSTLCEYRRQELSPGEL